MDEAQKAKLEATCSCGSGKMYGVCCGKEEMCFCGSGKAVKDCCMVAPEAHGVDPSAVKE
ncbi:MAG: hypothetical protein A3C50_00270 [Candidatus Staskawiczbacteria bacterium RIFCSPHIGHO2_02_FULL_43_16]|uniref:Uncharacterized protein n=1 Tax=Candidatus Staskawiczbacteria bacterium RIFCSPHIGHO2_01_FULL_41_41 TaxID=1802203 RepID=A0A1G2HVP4_9BACT|nr:MAG: hypothetical protein A2822_01935 [Candidatus Staskawiczbacteria bacterium RIFCSPHIGHO2_01_FULL_41_41]OGZ68924.1 MAG: hypothetical protein A3C50_00270 [Candidatus Staskawiczbacteria bacterium RIFCSPHIGHO2_02_FULL_43_16]OGZ74894.1 MAG: hypothetical protein A3A12_03545 [Candidatus Staskawiczbacteria bacterium RIFCSPLOWO2_01_FULL_43_17b]